VSGAATQPPSKTPDPADEAPAAARLRDSRAFSPPAAVATVVLAAVVAAVQPTIALGVLRGLLVLTVVPCAVIDAEQRIIPNRITGPAALAILVAGLALDLHHEPRRLVWGAAAGLFLLIASLVHPSGMGMGDVKLLAVMGLALGAPVVIALLVAMLATLLVGVGIAGRQGIRVARKTALPFGPYLALGAVVAAVLAGPLLHISGHH
jgi:leader peptidase (prepilin peptidase)/N-methyltransferase